MKRYWILVVLMAFIAGLNSCEKEIPLEDIEPEPLLVVNGFQHVGEPARLLVEKSSFYINSESDFRVKDVKADLYVNGEFKESLQVRDSIIMETYIDWNNGDEIEYERLVYAFNYCEGTYLLCEGDELRFEVSSSDFDETAVAEIKMPYAPSVLDFDTLRIENDGSGVLNIYFSLTIDDAAGRDYYNFNPEDDLGTFITTDPVFSDFMDVESVDDLFGGAEYSSHYQYNLFSDVYFDGTPYEITMKVVKFGDEHYEGSFPMEVSRVDEGFYQYEKSKHLYYNNEDEFTGLFTEPIQVYSNVRNGVGVVCAQSLPVVKTVIIGGGR